MTNLEAQNLITIIFFNQDTRQLQLNPNITKLNSHALYVDADGTAYRIQYYNATARVAFALLKES